MCLYLIRNKANNKIYVGKTVQPLSLRMSQHVCRAAKGSGNALHAAIRKYGRANFSVVALFKPVTTLFTEEHLLKLEQVFIKLLRATERGIGYNRSTGGEGMSGVVMSEESRRKMSFARKGRVFSDEARRNMGRSRKGVAFSLEHKRRISASLIQTAHKTNKSGHRGVFFTAHLKKWRAYIRFNGVHKHLGYFSDFNDAVAARLSAEASILNSISQGALV